MKKKIILLGKDGRPSMKGTYSKMQTNDSILLVKRTIRRNNVTYLRQYSNNNVTTLVKRPVSDLTNIPTGSIIIRWGNRIQMQHEGNIVYNKATAQELATNKYQARLKMDEEGVSIPKTSNNPNLTFFNSADYPIIARPYFHSKGKNFVILKTQNEVEAHKRNHSNWYYSGYIPKTHEYRVHVGHSKILNYLEKPNPGNGNIAWNRAQNHEAFVNVGWDSYNLNVGIEAIKAVKALGLDFGGVDVIVDAQGTPYVLEVNTSPTLNSSEYSMERYSKYFDWLFKSETKMKHWDYTKFTKAKSLAWKNFQFDGNNTNSTGEED